MDELLGDARDIEKIDENMIGAKWMNEMFLDFVFHYAIRVSKNRQFVISRLVQEDVSIFQCITASDVAWAVTCYVNNKEFWNTKINAKGGGTNQKKAARHTRRTSAVEEKESSDDETEGNREAQGKGPRARWTNKTTQRAQGDGWEMEGKLFYEKVRVGLKGIDLSRWDDMWSEYWEEEKKRHMSKRSKKSARGGMTMDDELMVESGDEDVMFGSSDEENSDGDMGGGEYEGGDGEGEVDLDV